MFNYKHYVPILKAKEGEFKALEVTYEETKDLMTPLLEIVEVPWNYDDEIEAKDLNSHLANIAEKTLNSWGTIRPIFIDSDAIESNRIMNDNITHHMIFLFDDFRDKELNAIPVTSLSKHVDYKNSIRLINQRDKKGIVLRLKNEDFANVDLITNIDSDLEYYEVQPNEVDLILDLGSIVNMDNRLLSLLIINLINNIIPYTNDWRTLTFAATAFPIDLSEIISGTFDTIDRNEWIVWNILLTSNIQRVPTFGDYSIAHPDIVGINPKFIKMSASIRYTSDNYWLIARGRGIQRYGAAQYHSLSEELITKPEYSGLGFSWADNHINECAAQRVGTGNPTTWRKVANNHHFTKTVSQISILP